VLPDELEGRRIGGVVRQRQPSKIGTERHPSRS
jgi:hypothetical protein